MSFFISDALAATPAAGAASTGAAWSNMLVMLLIFIAVMYFMIWRPQSRRMKAHQTMVDGLKKGDEVLTNSGLLGKITKIGDNFITVMLAENVEIPMQKNAISSVLPKGTLKKL